MKLRYLLDVMALVLEIFRLLSDGLLKLPPIPKL